MSPNVFDPRRLRESLERPSSIEGRLARQLRVLAVCASTPQLRRYSALARRQRYILTAVRVATVATLFVVPVIYASWRKHAGHRPEEVLEDEMRHTSSASSKP